MGALRVLPLENVDIHPSTAKRIEQKTMSKKEDGYTPLPNFVCDEGYLAVLSGEAIKCLVLLNRHIKGFHEENKAIGESLILKLAGFKDKRTVRKAMSDLAKYNIVKITKTLGKATSYEVTFEDRLSIELVALNVTSASKVVTSNVPRLVASDDTGTSSIKCHSVKEKKINLKESEQQENPVDEVLNIWKPDLQQLNSWMQRSGLPKINQAQVEELLLEINPHYESKIHTGAVTSNQMYSNFVKWVKRDYKLVERLFQQASGVAQNINPSELKADMGGLVMSNIHNIPMEQAVLTALMTVDKSFDVVSNDLDVECFFPERHKQIFQAIADLANENKPYDFVMVEQQLKQKNVVHLMGGSEYLVQMCSEAPSSFYNLESYVAELNKFKAHREVEHIGQSIAEIAKDLTIPDVHIAAESILDGKKTSNDVEKTSFTFEEALNRASDRLIQKAEAKAAQKYTGIQFNLKHLDNLVGTIQKGHFCVIGGRPGSGKSTLAQMLAIQTAKHYGESVLFISAEMDVETMANRCVSALANIPYDNIHNAELYDGMLQDFVKAKKRFEQLPIHIEDKQKPTIAEIHSWARKAKRKYKKIGCIVIDYLQLVRDPSKKERFNEVSSISRDLKALAKEFNCPVIALAQLNRESEKGKRPKASDLRESGQIEQDADQIILANPIMGEDDLPLGVTELIVAKNRHGKKGVVRVMDRLDICRFVTIREEGIAA